jgi:hypothetical protein
MVCHGQLPDFSIAIPTDDCLGPDGNENHQRDYDCDRVAGQMKHPIILLGAPSLAELSCRIGILENQIQNNVVRLASALSKFRHNPVPASDFQGFSPSHLSI